MQSSSGVLVTSPIKKKVLPKANSNKRHIAGEEQRKKREATKQRWSVEAIWKADGSNSV